MKLHAVAVPALVLSLGLAVFSNVRPAAADESGNFMMKLGADTTSVERYSRSSSRLEVDQVGRAPRVIRRHFTYEYTNGVASKLSFTAMPPVGSTPLQTLEATVGADSLRLDVHNASGPPQTVKVKTVPGMSIVTLTSPWSVYEGLIMKLVSSKKDTLGTAVYFVGANSTDWLSMKKLGRDSILVSNTHLDVFHVAVDKTGRVMGVLPIAGTAKFSVQRLDKLDLDAVAAAFVAREQASGNLGALSPRDTVKVAAAGANLWVDYGRPSKRGRPVFGAALVPYGEVWRTGANAATQFKTDKDLVFGDVTVPAGFYTLWTLPTASGWTLIVNSETGQWGTQHKPEKDLYKIPMTVSTQPQVVEKFTIGVTPSAQGGAINLDWDTTRASATFAVKPSN